MLGHLQRGVLLAGAVSLCGLGVVRQSGLRTAVASQLGSLAPAGRAQGIRVLHVRALVARALHHAALGSLAEGQEAAPADSWMSALCHRSSSRLRRPSKWNDTISQADAIC